MLFIPLLVLAIDHVFNLDIQKLNIAPWNFPNFLYWAIFFSGLLMIIEKVINLHYDDTYGNF